MATNNSYNKHFSRMNKSKAQIFAYYEAQPAHVRAWFQQFPANVWPDGFSSVERLIPDSEARHLAGLEAVWGPDHPAVQDARQKIHVKRGKVQRVADLNDLDDFDF